MLYFMCAIGGAMASFLFCCIVLPLDGPERATNAILGFLRSSSALRRARHQREVLVQQRMAELVGRGMDERAARNRAETELNNEAAVTTESLRKIGVEQ